jgi:acetyl-CoA synthetase
MSEPEVLETSEAQIAVHWKEEEYIYPPARFISQANMTDPGIYERFSLEHFPECFKEYADLLTWYQYWQTTLDTSDAPCWKWFVGGMSMPATTVWTGIYHSIKTRRPLFTFPNPKTSHT